MSPHDPARTDQSLIGHAAEADAAEQAAPVADDDMDLDPVDEAAAQVGRTSAEADPADVWEQSLPVVDADDDYDHSSPD